MKKRRILSCILLMALLISVCPLAYASVGNPPAYVRQYGVTPFEEEYASGYMLLYGATPGPGTTHNTVTWIRNNLPQEAVRDMGSDWDNIDEVMFGNNHSKQDDVYIDFSTGAVMNGTVYAVRVYPWIVTSSQARWCFTYGPYISHLGSDVGSIFHMEFHFYEAGHCGDPNYEVTFKGVIFYADLDADAGTPVHEGYNIPTGGVNVWSEYPTSINFTSSTRFVGTERRGDYVNCAWGTVIGSPGAPLHLEYDCYGVFWSVLEYKGASINYVIQGDGVYPLPAGAESVMGPNHGSAIYGVYRYASAPAINGWQFDGWYYDAGRTQRVNATDVITADKTVYGTYHRVIFGVSTSVSNGSITPTNNNVALGTNHTVYYSPANGYLLTSVIVDGSPVNIASYPDSYTFANVTADHSISVAYVAPSASKSWA